MKSKSSITGDDSGIAGAENRPAKVKPNSLSTSRRGFLKTAGVGVAAMTAGAALPSGLAPEAEAIEIGPPSQNPSKRASQSDQVRHTTSLNESQAIRNAFPHSTNGDEETYANQSFAGNFSKTLPHDPVTGLVVPSAYQALMNGFTQGTQAALDAVPAGGPGRLAGPLSPLAFQLQGLDTTAATQVFVPPSINSAGGAAEMVELYWESFLRDVNFNDYASNPLIGQAVTDLNRLSGYAGPKPVTAQNIFRYGTGSAFPNANAFFGADAGPYISQVLYQGGQGTPEQLLDGIKMVPMISTFLPVADPNTGQVLTGSGTGIDFMTNFPEYLFVEDGKGALDNTDTTDPQPRFIRNGRDLGSLVSHDSIFSIYFRAAIILQNLGVGVQPSSPYAKDTRINGFNTFSTAWLFNLIGAAQQTEGPAFYQKWFVHRKLRPEAFANLVDGILGKRFTLSPSLHPDLLNSAILPLIFQRNQQLNVKRSTGTTGSFLLPQENNGGSPSHPDPPSGHAFTAGCSVTLLKAVFDVGTPSSPKPWPVPPVQPSADGLSLVPTSDSLTLLGELNKLAFNVAEGRDWLGIHSRLGGNSLGMTLGEATAIALLNDLGFTYPESFSGFTLTKFDGTVITVGAKQTVGTTTPQTTCPVA